MKILCQFKEPIAIKRQFDTLTPNKYELFADRSIAPCTFDKNYPKEVARDFHEKSTIEVEMATVQAHQELNLPVSQKTTDYISLTMAALSFVNPWAVSTKPSSWVEPEIGSPEARDRVITLAEVTYHDSPRDCWVVIYDRVYDITTFLDEHPGGADIMLEYAGRDASTAFRGSGHSVQAAKALDRFIVGELPMHERMYRRPGGMRLSDIPE